MVEEYHNKDNPKKLSLNNTDLQIIKAEEYMKKINDQLSDRVSRIDKIKNSHAKFEHQIEKLQSGKNLQSKNTIMDIIDEITKTRNNLNNIGFSSKQIDMMERAISRMSNQIDDVLEFVKIQSLRTTKNSLLDTIGLSLAKIKKSDNIKINIPDKDVEFVYDADKIEVVLDNLLTNALQAINASGEITIRINDKGKDRLSRGLDSASGVPDDIISKVFEPLFTTKIKGTGLGLASCKSIIEQHGGSITVKNKPSVFTIKLPKMLEISTI